MKKTLSVLLIGLMLMITLSACSNKVTQYEFLHSKEEIEKVEIVFVDGYTSGVISNYTVKAEINNMDEFMEKFEKILFSKYHIGDPTYISDEYAILLTYDNGDYEFISFYAQQFVKSGEAYFGMVYCDEEEFKTLINTYLE